MSNDGSDQTGHLLELNAHRQITDLIHRYAFHVRNGEPATCVDLMADDVTFTIRERYPSAGKGTSRTRAELAGRDDVLAYICRSAGGPVRVFPIIHNLLIDVSGDDASSNCLMTSRTWPQGSEFLGEYHDTFRRSLGTWRFSSRSFTMFRSEE